MCYIQNYVLFFWWKNKKVLYLTDNPTAYMRQLNLPPLIWNVSHLKIFPLELLGPAIGLSAGPSSCKGKILRWDTTTNSLTTNKCPILDVVSTITNYILLFTYSIIFLKYLLKILQGRMYWRWSPLNLRHLFQFFP